MPVVLMGGLFVHLLSFQIRNFRRLKDVRIDLRPDTSIFVGPNNSGKTSATHVFQLFLGGSKEPFSLYDFSADCWAVFDKIGINELPLDSLPTIDLDLWFHVEESDIHRVVKLLPSLDWSGAPIGVRMRFAPKDATTLLANFSEAKNNASKSILNQKQTSDFHPWPETLTDYLKKRISEYKIFYYVLDRSEFDADYHENPDYNPQELGDTTETGGIIIKSLVRVDFLNAQRHLSDESKGRAEDLSKRLSRFYERNLQKHEDDFEVVKALADSEAQLNAHLSAVFSPILESLNQLGYPGFADPDLVIKSALDPESILLSKNASVHYALRDPGNPAAPKQNLTLPDKYNGLGFKNLIYMVIEILDFQQRWADEEQGRPPLHLIIIEEPEAHLHVQLQQVFIQKIRDILPDESPLFISQLIVTTHSPHIIYESNFEPIRYFLRSNHIEVGNYSKVLNLSHLNTTEKASREFLFRYMKLTHCDLFFADAAVLVEGNVERLLMPLMIEKEATILKSSYLSIIEISGAFAHGFKTLIQFLGLTTLVITDLDSVKEKTNISTADSSVKDNEEQTEESAGACMVYEPGAVTSNQTLIQWIPKLKNISDLLSASTVLKAPAPTADAPAKICVAYQTQRQVVWNGEKTDLAGRTFEEAFAYENLTWCQDTKRRSLHLRVVKKTTSPPLVEVSKTIHDRVQSRGFNKTDFALALMMEDTTEWVVPHYIAEGLRWLSDQLFPPAPDSTETEAAQ